jgi:hypothetical protein
MHDVAKLVCRDPARAMREILSTQYPGTAAGITGYPQTGPIRANDTSPCVRTRSLEKEEETWMFYSSYIAGMTNERGSNRGSSLDSPR